MITLVSLGLSCQSAQQMTRFAAENQRIARFSKSPFDWLICPPRSFERWLAAGLPDFNNGDITDYRDHAFWQEYEFWFWHGFFVKEDGGSRLDIETTVERELGKLAYQRSVFKALDPATTLFVVSNTQNNLETDVFQDHERPLYHFDKDLMFRIQAAVDTYFNFSANLHWMTRSDRCSHEVSQLPNVSLLETDETEWKGDDEQWNRAIRAALVLTGSLTI